MFRLFSESMLANVLAFEAAGVPHQELTQAVGRDGGTIVGRGVVFQTPIQSRLSEDDAKLLLQTYSSLLSDYNADRLGVKRLKRIKRLV